MRPSRADLGTAGARALICAPVARTRPGIVVLASLLSLAPAGCQTVFSRGSLRTPPAAVAPAYLAGIPNYAKVSDALARGGMPTELGFSELQKSNIRTIVSLRVLDSDGRHLEGLGKKYRHISFKHVHPEDEDVLTFLAIVTDPANQPVFVHCLEGVDRTGMMVAVYRIVVQGWTKSRAIAEMLAMGFNGVNLPILRYVERFDVNAIKRELSGKDSRRS